MCELFDGAKVTFFSHVGKVCKVLGEVEAALMLPVLPTQTVEISHKLEVEICNSAADTEITDLRTPERVTGSSTKVETRLRVF
jgi:hypothetical protein